MSTVKTDAQFMERFENFAFKEVVEEESVALETNTRYLAILASLVGSQGLDAYKFILNKALDEGMDPIMVKEMVYQSIDYVGMSRMWSFLAATNEIYQERNISLDAGEATTTMSDRLEKGAQAQVEIFGEHMKEAWKTSVVNRWLAANCFGDYYTRTGLDLAQREMITFCFLMSQGGCEPQLIAHSKGNMNNHNCGIISMAYHYNIPDSKELKDFSVIIIPTTLVLINNQWSVSDAIIVYYHNKIKANTYLQNYYNEIKLGPQGFLIKGSLVSITNDYIFNYKSNSYAMKPITPDTRYKKSQIYYDIWHNPELSVDSFILSITKEEVAKPIEVRFNIKEEE